MASAELQRKNSNHKKTSLNGSLHSHSAMYWLGMHHCFYFARGQLRLQIQWSLAIPPLECHPHRFSHFCTTTAT